MESLLRSSKLAPGICKLISVQIIRGDEICEEGFLNPSLNFMPELSDGLALASCADQCSIIVYSQFECAVYRNPTVTYLSLRSKEHIWSIPP